MRAGVEGAAQVLLDVSTIVPQSPGTTARQDTTVSREGSPAGGLDALAAVALNKMDLDFDARLHAAVQSYVLRAGARRLRRRRRRRARAVAVPLDVS